MPRTSPLPPNLEPGCKAVRVYCSRKEAGGLHTLSWRIAISFRDVVVEIPISFGDWLLGRRGKPSGLGAIGIVLLGFL